jgi:hypothetical protein
MGMEKRRILTAALIAGLMFLAVVSSARIADALSVTVLKTCGGMNDSTCIGLGAQGVGSSPGDGTDGNLALTYSFSGGAAHVTFAGWAAGETIVLGFEPLLIDPNADFVKLNVSFTPDNAWFLLNFSPFGDLATLLVRTGHFGGVGLAIPNQSVPEPATLVLLGVGIAGFGVVARRISRQRSAA